MKLSVVLALLLLAPAARATTYVFRVTNWHDAAVGYLDTSVSQEGAGALFLGGYRFPLTCFDCWWMIGVMDEGSHGCVVVHPYAPWIVGLVTWKEHEGQIDVLSTDWVWWELDADVETVIGDWKGRRP